MNIQITRNNLEAATNESGEAVAREVKNAIEQACGSLTAETLTALNAEQVTLWAFFILHDEVMDGGFVQLIHNGYGPFFFRNPFTKAMQLWGIDTIVPIMRHAEKLYRKHGADIEKPCSDEAFMALFEQFPQFDDLDDEFIEEEENICQAVGQYVADHLERFVEVVN
ncbi:MAG: DMP19 family protein [Prevotellamassilia sp.]|nr:DMP19 family protein [Prevotellamassilia sp.]MCI6143829.1 DMP19 family protein [Bacteroidales bacterium]MDY6112992.1 DMP19 family protein [Alloprevotella sp.]